MLSRNQFQWSINECFLLRGWRAQTILRGGNNCIYTVTSFVVISNIDLEMEKTHPPYSTCKKRRVWQRFGQKLQVNCGIFYSCFNLSVWIYQVHMKLKWRFWQVFWWSRLRGKEESYQLRLYCENIYRYFQNVLTGHTLTQQTLLF